MRAQNLKGQLVFTCSGSGAQSSPPTCNEVQRVFQVGAFKARQEAVTGMRQSVEEVSRQWNLRVTVSSGEKITPALMQASVLAWDWLLKRDSTRSLIVEAPPYPPLPPPHTMPLSLLV